MNPLISKLSGMVRRLKEKNLLIIIVFLTFQAIILPGTIIIRSQTSDWKITELSRVSTGEDAYSLLVEDDYCYVTCGYSGFKIFDVSDRSNPELVAYFPQVSDD